jgi:hypothetical protein
MPTATVRLAPPPGTAPTRDLDAALAEVDRRLGAGVAMNLLGATARTLIDALEAPAGAATALAEARTPSPC